MYFKFQYSIHIYFVEKGQCHNEHSVPSQNGNVAYTIAIGIHLHKKFNTRELTDIAYMYLSLYKFCSDWGCTAVYEAYKLY